MSEDYFVKFFAQHGCTLLEKKVRGSYKPLKYICSCGKEAVTTFFKFRNGKRCSACAAKRTASKTRKSFQDVEAAYSQRGCKLLSNESEYVNFSSKLTYVCKCGVTKPTTHQYFVKGMTCKTCNPRPTSFSYETVKALFEKGGCNLLSEEYINSKQKLRYICSCGEEAVIEYRFFQKGGRCKKCSVSRAVNKLKFTYEEVKAYFEEQGCQLTSQEYHRSSDVLDYICSCGNPAKIRYMEFRRGHRCIECSRKSHTLKYEDVKDYLESYGCKLISTAYVNVYTPITYECACGNVRTTTFGSFKSSQDKKCKKCFRDGLPTLKSSRELFEKHGCTLLAMEYVKADTPMPYICSCGNKSKISLSNFKKGHRCMACGREKQRMARQERLSTS